MGFPLPGVHRGYFWGDVSQGSDVYDLLGNSLNYALYAPWARALIRIGKVHGERNVADHLTKDKMWWNVAPLLQPVGGHMIPRAAVGRPARWGGVSGHVH